MQGGDLTPRTPRKSQRQRQADKKGEETEETEDEETDEEETEEEVPEVPEVPEPAGADIVVVQAVDEWSDEDESETHDEFYARKSAAARANKTQWTSRDVVR